MTKVKREKLFENLRDRVIVNDLPSLRDAWSDKDRSKSQWGEWTFEIVEIKADISTVKWVEVRALRTAGAGSGATLETKIRHSLGSARGVMIQTIDGLFGYATEKEFVVDYVSEKDYKGKETPITENKT